jgi:ornithine carbamoyltransferase
MRHLISLKEQTKEDILEILRMARVLKEKHASEEVLSYLRGKTMVMFFEKSSTRTRVSFEGAMTELGGHAIFLDKKTTQFSLAKQEHEIQVLLRLSHILMMRMRRADDVILASSFNRVPVIDGCSERYHPAQTLADLLTMAEHSGDIEHVKRIAYLGIENNVSNTLKLACTKLGIEVVLGTPDYDDESLDQELNQMADDTGLIARATTAGEAVKDADYVHTDTWMNMEFFENGEVRVDMKEEFEKRKNLFMPFQLSARLIDTHAPSARIMHCMPCHIGYEITDDAFNHKNSVILDQAENRLHVQKAIILWLLGIKI